MEIRLRKKKKKRVSFVFSYTKRNSAGTSTSRALIDEMSFLLSNNMQNPPTEFDINSHPTNTREELANLSGSLSGIKDMFP